MSGLTTEEIEALQVRLIVAIRREQAAVTLNPRELDYLVHLVDSHLKWRGYWLKG